MNGTPISVGTPGVGRGGGRTEALRAWFGSPREWCVADRIVLVAAFTLPIAIAYAALGYYLLGHPEVALFADRRFVRDVALRLHVGFFIPAWFLLVGVAVLVRRRPRTSAVLVYALSGLWFGWFGVCSYFFGTHTSMYTTFIVLGGVAFGLTLFDRRPVLLGAAVFFAVVTATTAAEQLRLVPYAPMLLDAPFRERHLATSWLLIVGTMDFVSVIAIMALIYTVIERWKRDERALAQTSEQLARANDVISRYVASQLAQRILAGDYASVDRHARRRLTLFFSDIKGFAEIADRMEPEDLSEMLNEYLSEMVLIGERYGGTIDKFIGDAIMIFFGAPAALDDREQALRAVRMAMEMQARLVELRARWHRRGFEHPLQIRIGINTGQASIGNFGSNGRMDYTAIGRQVNLAARLQGLCEPGKVLISHTTWVLIQDDIACVPRGEMQVKGFHIPVAVYEVVGPTATTDGAESLATS